MWNQEHYMTNAVEKVDNNQASNFLTGSFKILPSESMPLADDGDHSKE